LIFLFSLLPSAPSRFQEKKPKNQWTLCARSCRIPCLGPWRTFLVGEKWGQQLELGFANAEPKLMPSSFHLRGRPVRAGLPTTRPTTDIPRFGEEKSCSFLQKKERRRSHPSLTALLLDPACQMDLLLFLLFGDQWKTLTISHSSPSLTLQDGSSQNPPSGCFASVVLHRLHFFQLSKGRTAARSRC